MTKDCFNCANNTIPKSPACGKCIASFYEGVQTSDPSEWRLKYPEIIRCQHCQYHEHSDIQNRVWCRKMGRYMKEDGFCSEGKAKDNDT